MLPVAKTFAALALLLLAGCRPNRVRVTVDERGFRPPTVQGVSGTPLVVVFTRVSENAPADAVAVEGPTGIEVHELPWNRPTPIKIVPDRYGYVHYGYPR